MNSNYGLSIRLYYPLLMQIRKYFLHQVILVWKSIKIDLSRNKRLFNLYVSLLIEFFKYLGISVIDTSKYTLLFLRITFKFVSNERSKNRLSYWIENMTYFKLITLVLKSMASFSLLHIPTKQVASLLYNLMRTNKAERSICLFKY